LSISISPSSPSRDGFSVASVPRVALLSDPDAFATRNNCGTVVRPSFGFALDYGASDCSGEPALIGPYERGRKPPQGDPPMRPTESWWHDCGNLGIICQQRSQHPWVRAQPKPGSKPSSPSLSRARSRITEDRPARPRYGPHSTTAHRHRQGYRQAASLIRNGQTSAWTACAGMDRRSGYCLLAVAAGTPDVGLHAVSNVPQSLPAYESLDGRTAGAV